MLNTTTNHAITYSNFKDKTQDVVWSYKSCKQQQQQQQL